MIRFAVALSAVALCCLPAAGGAAPAANDAAAPDVRTRPMKFAFWTEGPARTCGNHCRSWVSAAGAITADTPNDFEAFAKGRNLTGVSIVLDSDGGSVLGALALGRAIRRLGMTTTVGKTVDLSSVEDGKRRARLVSRANCESMCAFVLLAGVERHVPAQAQVMVHQIWLGDRRDDPTAANYSAEDLMVVQRDIGRLARYTVEMGGGIGMLEIALKIPPWEPMRLLSRDELRDMGVVAADAVSPDASSGASLNSLALANGARARANGRNWRMLPNAKPPALGRSHPLTIEGEEIGTFELSFGCGKQRGGYVATYIERRRGEKSGRMPATLTAVEMSLSGQSLPLTVVVSRVNGKPGEVGSVATGGLPAELLRAFADRAGRSLTLETTSPEARTSIRVGNAGLAHALPRLIARCTGRPRLRNTAHNNASGGG